MKNRSLIVAALLALGAAVAIAVQLSGGDPTPRVRAQEVVAQFAGALQTELQNAMQERGPVHAIAVCSERAPLLAGLASSDDLRVRRIGTRVRNRATNVPTEAERAVLERFAALPEAERAAAFEEVEASGRYAYYAPIFVGKPVCIACHGPADGIGPEVRAALAQRYPDDEATGYALGDLRGAFVVEIDR